MGSCSDTIVYNTVRHGSITFSLRTIVAMKEVIVVTRYALPFLDQRGLGKLVCPEAWMTDVDI
jgi:hypothetical protein